MPFNNEGRSLLRTIAVGGALLGSLAIASPANAALAGGPFPVFSDRPSLESVTFEGEIASFKFNRPVVKGTGFAVADFRLTTYRAGNYILVADTANFGGGGDGSVVEVTFDDTTTFDDLADFDHTPVATVLEDTVQGIGTFNQGNYEDSVAVTGADGESGTRGHTSEPDLVSATLDSVNNRIRYTYDQDVSGITGENPPDPTDHGFIDIDGVEYFGTTAVTVTGNVVIVQFAQDVDTARQAFVNQTAANGLRETAPNGNPVDNVPLAGKNPLNAAPTVVSAVLEPNSGTIVYTYDQPIGNPDANDLYAYDSSGDPEQADLAVVVGQNAVRATFPIQQFSEHIVHAADFGGGVTDVDNNDDSAPSGAPVGGNAGAKSSGYTTAPDGLAASVNDSNGQVVVLMDSRVAPMGVTAADFDLLSSDGDLIAAAPAAVTFDTSTSPQQTRVVLQYSVLQAQLAEGGAIALDDGAVEGTHPNDPFSVSQILPLNPTDAVFGG